MKKLYDLFSKEELDAQIEAKMVKGTPHPTLPLTIYNYTQVAQFTPELWNHVTDQCRGLIVDSEMNLIARPFRKFWNYDDPRHPETLPENFPSILPTITRKFDGSLGIMYRDAIATRGSFSSEQAEWATSWIRKQKRNDWPEGFTPLFEIVYPQNQIVVKYDFSGLVLLAMVNIETGEEVGYDELQGWARLNDVRVVDRFDKVIATLTKEDDPNEEGYVVAWNRPGATPIRVKVKFETYRKLHRLLTGTNAVTVWEMLRDGLDLTTLTRDVPEEFQEWIKGLEARFISAFNEIESSAEAAFNAFDGEKDPTDPIKKKAFALYAMAQSSSITPILFAMLCGKPYAPIIWKQIRPRGDERPFRTDEA